MLSSSTKNFNTKLNSYITDPWNIVDVATIVIFVIGIMLRFLPYQETLEAARCVMALNLVIFFFRILHIFSVHKQLGPKLVMIGRMVSMQKLTAKKKNCRREFIPQSLVYIMIIIQDSSKNCWNFVGILVSWYSKNKLLFFQDIFICHSKLTKLAMQLIQFVIYT